MVDVIFDDCTPAGMKEFARRHNERYPDSAWTIDDIDHGALVFLSRKFPLCQIRITPFHEANQEALVQYKYNNRFEKLNTVVDLGRMLTSARLRTILVKAVELGVSRKIIRL